MKLIKHLLAVCLGVCMAGAVQAAPITVAFTGTVTQIPNFDPADPFGGSIGSGTTFTGHYTFDSAAIDRAADAQTGSYDASGPPYSLVIAFGSPIVFSVAFDDFNLGIGNDFGNVDFYTLAAAGTAPAAGLSASLVLIDAEGSAFGDDTLPVGAPALGDFESRVFLLAGTFVGGNGLATQIEILGTLDTLACTTGCSVPAPGALALLGTGLAALAACRRRSTAAAGQARRSTTMEEPT